MKMIFRVFLQGNRIRSLLVLLSFLVAATVEAIGMGALLPAAAAIMGQDGEVSGGSITVKQYIEWLGITPSFENIVLLIGAATVLKAIISFIALSYAAVVAADMTVGFQRRLIHAVTAANWRFYSDQHVGNLATAIANDAAHASQAYLFAAQVFAAALQAILLGAMALFYDWKLALGCILVGFAISVVMNRLVRLARSAGGREANTTSSLTISVVDLVANMKPLKAMHRFEPMLPPIQRALLKLRLSLITGEMSKQALNLGNDVIVTLIVAIAAYFAFTSWNVTLPDLLVITVIFFKINSMFAKVQKAMQQSAKFERFYVRISEIIKNAESQREANPGKLEVSLTSGCRFQNVSFSHGNSKIINKINLEIPAGQITVLRGPSGAGKTTIIDLLIGFYQPSDGCIMIDGVPLSEIDLQKWRRKIGYVPQELSLLHQDIRKNISFGDPAITDEMIWSSLRQAKADEFVKAYPSGLDASVGEMGRKMSGGQRQRISLARAMVGSPQLLILDEVTSALDPVTEQEIVNNIASLRGAYTIIAITHRPAWADIADRLYDVDSGKVRAHNSEFQVLL